MEHRTVLSNVTHAHLNKKKRQSMAPSLLKTGSSKVHGMKNSRLSLGPGTLSSHRPSLGGSMTSLGAATKGPRHSLAPNAGAGTDNRRRKSSVGTNMLSHNLNSGRQSNVFSSTVLKNDPRPISNKGFMHASIRKLIQFLSEHNYDHPISPKILSRPTGKDFQNVLQFLFLLVDRNLKFGQKFTDEVPPIFKGLCYPFNISKTALSAVGSLHTWPPLLASLIWLMELLEYHEVETQRESDMDMENGDKVFFTYLRQAYQSFLCGDDDKSEELDNELLGTFEERDLAIQEQTDQLRAQREGLLKDLDKIKNSKSSLPALTNQKRDYKEDLVKFQGLVKKLKEHKDNLEAKLRSSEAEFNARQQELEEALGVKAKLQKQLEEQELSPADAERIMSEREAATLEQAQTNEKREEMQKSTWEVEMTIANKLADLEQMTTKYNEIASRLKLIPRSAQNSQGVDFEIKLNLSGFSNGENLLNVDVKKILKTSLISLKDSAMAKTNEIKTQCLELQDQVEKNEEEKVELESKILQLEQEIKELDKTSIAEKEEAERERKRIADKVDDASRRLHELRLKDKSFEELESSKFQLRQLEKALQDEKLEFDRQEAELDEAIQSSLEMVVEHKQEVEELINAVLERQSKRMNEALLRTQSSVSSLANLIDTK